MNCNDLEETISRYLDGELSADETSLAEEHFAGCPLCRQHVDDLRSIRSDLRQLMRPAMPHAASHDLRLALREAVASKRTPMSPWATDWIKMRVMPWTVGLAASLVVGVSFLSMLMSGGRGIDQYVAKNVSDGPPLMVAASTRTLAPDEISALEFARNRMAVASDSPSINPQGTLAALSDTLSRNGIRNNEVVVVADVFSNGLARIAEVVEPSRNARVIDELQQALDTDLADAPFVPASMDNRSGSVRVVLKFQSVEVNSGGNKKRR